MRDQTIEFVEKLLDGWELDQWTINGEFGAGPEDARAVEQEISDRRAEWEVLKREEDSRGTPW